MGWPIERTERDGRPLAFAVSGSGPWLLLPRCNVDWFDFTDLAGLTHDHTVVVASPLGFGTSGRGRLEAYALEASVADLLHVCSAVGAERFDVIGYSLTGALAAVLACTSGRVLAAAVGGFPLLGSYARVRDAVEPLVRDPEFVAGLGDVFDPLAALAFYRDLAEWGDGDLVDRRRCPMAAFWGRNDAILQSFDSSGDLSGGLQARGVPVSSFEGLDHDAVLLHLDEVFADAAAWLADQPR